MNLTQVAQVREHRLVAQRDVDDAVVGEGRHGRDGSRFLPAAHGAIGDEQAGVFAPETTRSPEAAGRVPESLPLSGEVALRDCCQLDGEFSL